MNELIENNGISAKILLDSVNPVGDRLTTWMLIFPRWILAEINTHRAFSRNTSSSRAIPTEKLINMAVTNPAMPVFWGKNQSGMQSSVELTGGELVKAKDAWLRARDRAVESARELLSCGMHKQYVNRTIENFLYIKTILSATELENFFSLRAHPAAQPEFQKLAYLMLDLYQQSIPMQVRESQWHIPFGDKMPEGLTHEQKLKIATARCARTSYLTFDGEMDAEKDYAIHDKLATSGHWSPFEHCAQALGERKQVGNFIGWKQYRKTFISENRTDGRVQRYNRT